MTNYDSDNMELSTRDVVTRAIYQEVASGRGGPQGGIFADMSHHDKSELAKKQPGLFDTYQMLGIDVSKDPIEVFPTCHFFMGGIQVKDNWETEISGLYVVGEAVGGLHGANRLSQNALSELLVSGKIAGREAAESAKLQPTFEETSDQETLSFGNLTNDDNGILNEHLKELTQELHFLKDLPPSTKEKTMNEGPSQYDPREIRDRIHEIMDNKAGVIRTNENLIAAKNELLELQKLTESKQKVDSKGQTQTDKLLTALENVNLVKTARCVIEAALFREESRGAHFRTDYPKEDNDNWKCHSELKLTSENQLEIMKKPTEELDHSIVFTDERKNLND